MTQQIQLKNLLTVLPITTVVVAMSLAPSQALAFEATLPQATSQALVAQVLLIPQDRDSDLLITNQELPADSYQESAVAATFPSLKTEKGNWPKPVTRLASYVSLPKVLPTLKNPLVFQGPASFYSWDGCIGCNELRVMANGEQLNDNALTIAVPARYSYLVGRTATITGPNQVPVQVRITDTGGFEKYGRVADITPGVRSAIGGRGGLTHVELVVR